MARAVKWLVRLVFENFGWKALSLALAILLWALVASEPELSTIVNVPLEYKNLPDDLEIASEPVTSIALELRGASGVLRSLGDGSARPAVILDMSNAMPGERTFTISDGSVKLPRGVHLKKARPAQERFTFERRMVRRLPVVARFTGEGLHGYVIATHRVEPAMLTVVGPASHVARLDSVVTDAVDVSNVVAASEFRPAVYANDPYVRFQSSSQVKVMVAMRKK